MKRNILKGMILIGAIALGSCSTQNKMASTQTPDDDVYNTKAKAGEQPVYAARQDNYRQNNYRQDDNNGYSRTYNDNDYYNYDSYSARLNRFYNYSPFLSSYYDDLYYGQYTPYYNGYGLSAGLGFGYSGGGYFGYSPYSYYGYTPYAYAYNPYFGYSNYGYYGNTIGYGYSPYWGAVSYYNVSRTYNNPRPYRGSGLPSAAAIAGTSYTNRTTGITYNNANGYVSRPSRVGTSGNGTQPVGVNSTNSSNNNNNNNNASNGRPVRNQEPQASRPSYQPQPQAQPQSQPASSSSGNSNSGSSSSGSSGGGGRPVRP